MLTTRVAAMVAAVLALDDPSSGQSVEPFIGGHGATAPATYRGETAGADWHLDLWPDQAFHLRRTSPEGSAEEFAGRWHVDGETNAILLPLGDETAALVVRNSERLRPDAAPEDGGADLVADGTLDPVAIRLPVAGMFTYFADAPSLVHCATGHLHPVAQEGDYLALEAAYLADRPGPAVPLFVTLDATIAPREQMERPDRPMVVVDRFDATWPGEDCARAAADPSLTGTIWRIRSLEGKALSWSPPAREPYLVLRAGEGRFNASVGCNTMLGGFTEYDDGLSFTQPASTMMVCPDDLAEGEARLVGVLGATASHAIGGQTLRLFDAEGTPRAEFEAVYLP